jgi:hypothetical protein
MSLQIDGYLSQDIGKWIAKHRAEHATTFALADRLSRVGQQVMLGAEVSKGDDRALLILLFFARALSSFQGALLLAERGMTSEAQTLARSCLESAFFLGATAADASFADRLASSHTEYHKKRATWLTSREPVVTGLSPEQLDELRRLLDILAATPAASLQIKQAAETAHMLEVYETVYRDLSNRAAHPTLDSLRRHIELDDHDSLVALRFGPETKDVPETILAMTTALFYGLAGMSSAFWQDAWRAEIDACFEIYKQLIGTCEAVYDAQLRTQLERFQEK